MLNIKPISFFQLYKIYGQFSATEVHDALNKYNSSYIILEDSICLAPTSMRKTARCTLNEIMDLTYGFVSIFNRFNIKYMHYSIQYCTILYFIFLVVKPLYCRFQAMVFENPNHLSKANILGFVMKSDTTHQSTQSTLEKCLKTEHLEFTKLHHPPLIQCIIQNKSEIKYISKYAKQATNYFTLIRTPTCDLDLRYHFQAMQRQILKLVTLI